MTTSEVAQETCRHCKGTGLEPVVRAPAVPEGHTDEQRQLLEQLVEAGKRRAEYSRARGNVAMLQRRDQAYEDIKVYAAEANRLGITRQAVADAVGVGRPQLFKILSGIAGG